MNRIQSCPGGVTAAEGFLAWGGHVGIKKDPRPDLALIVSVRPAAVAGVFTQNRFPAAPVVWTQKVVKSGRAQAIIANSGAANACTGRNGERVAFEMARAAGDRLGLPPERVCVASTGLIGTAPSIERVRAGLPELVSALSRKGVGRAAEAIMTTDTRPKVCAFQTEIAGRRIRLGGIAKGSGMIHPRMATMLAFVTTDAPIDGPALRPLLREAVDRSFNRITVDGDTSTNDMVLCLANGAAGGKSLHRASERRAFFALLARACRALAMMIVQDGEGATKTIEIRITGARTREEARRAAAAVARSSLVKTAFYGADPNWGRIMAALGTAGIPLDPRRISIRYGEIEVVRGGIGRDEGALRAAKQVLSKSSSTVTIRLGRGRHTDSVWTTDLTERYIEINAAYRT